jgi:hypothetical protein
MDKQQALKTIEATLKALKGLQRAVAQDDRPLQKWSYEMRERN